ncbi:hypothetical protein H337_21875 [Vibrio parahaemolyticus EN9701121]|nr:hypothetical protein H337_21875 [Vibrio parahaemolyticus EN9701121]
MTTTPKKRRFCQTFPNTREIAQKLETVNDKLKAKTSHLVPPERT